MPNKQPQDADHETVTEDAEQTPGPLDGAPEVADKPQPEDADQIPEHGTGIADKPGPPL